MKYKAFLALPLALILLGAYTAANAEVAIEAEYDTKIIYGTDQTLDQEALRLDCSERGGVFNACGSPCEPGAEACITVCAFTCDLSPQEDEENLPPHDEVLPLEPKPHSPKGLLKRAENAKNELETRNERALEVRENVQAKLSARAEARLETALDRYSRRYTAAVDRLTNIADRMESRLDKLTESGHDMSTAYEALVRARAEIEAAESIMANFSAETDLFVASATPSDVRETIRSVAGDGKDALRGAKSALVEALSSARANVRVEAEAEIEAE